MSALNRLDELEVMEGSHTQGEVEYVDPVPIAAAGVSAYAVGLRPWADLRTVESRGWTKGNRKASQ